MNLDHGQAVKYVNHDAPNLISNSYVLIKCERQRGAALISTTKPSPQSLMTDKKIKVYTEPT